MSTRTKATIEDLYSVPGKAEIINGEIVQIMPTGGKPGRASGNVFFSLRAYEKTVGGGSAFGDNIGFIVDLPNRQSFSPDAAWYTGEIGHEVSERRSSVCRRGQKRERLRGGVGTQAGR